MGVDKLRELAIILCDRIRRNASIDWNLKESVRARMKVAVKRLLRQYGCPPDMEALATIKLNFYDCLESDASPS